MDNQRPKALAYVLSHPIQYFSPFLKALAKETALKVYYFSDASVSGGVDKGFGQVIKWDTPLLEGYEYEFIKNWSGHKTMDTRFLDAVNPGMVRALWKSPAKVVVVNDWVYCSTLLTIFFARLFGKKVWVRADNPLSKELVKRKMVIRIKKIFLKHILFRFFISRCLYTGVESRQFFAFYGVKPSKLLYTPHAVDNEYFAKQYEGFRGRLPELRGELGLPADKKIILFTGKYIIQKRPLDLLEAFSRLDQERYALVMVGEGGLRPEMEAYISEKGLKQVYLTGFVNQSQISKYYALADVFVLCSGSETWGLSVNEAMNFEKPVVISDACGCSADLVEQGKNGFIFPAGDIAELVSALERTLRDEEYMRSAGKRSGEIIQSFSIGHVVRNIKEALN